MPLLVTPTTNEESTTTLPVPPDRTCQTLPDSWNRSSSDAARVLEAFRDGVKSVGLVEGQGFVLDPRWAHGDLSRLPRLAGELVARSVDVIATAGGTASALAAKQAAATVPIVFVVGADPVEVGLVYAGRSLLT